EKVKLRFSVRDSGIGMTKEQADRLFHAFSQADTSTTRKFGGTGLGLVLSRRLADALGGTLELTESGENAGSTFVLEIATKLPEFAKLVPLESKVSISNVEIEAPRSARTLGGLNVLLVEDSLDNQMLITMYLNNEGAIVKSVGDGAQGVALALRDNFDVLLMDIQMPVLDGHEAAKRLRNSNYVGPIVALTAHAMKEERLKCIESGFNQFLTKPIQKKMLIEVLSRYVKPKITASLQI
ncbi:MAG: response regulator, partial [Bdellovibrionales bacterium]